MDSRLTACLAALAMAAVPGVAVAQSTVVPLQRGVSVQQAVTSHAVAVPNADRPDALVVTLSADGTAYFRADPLSGPELAERVRRSVATRTDKTLYIKADAHVPFARLVEVIDAVWTSGVEGVTLLTSQQEASDGGTPVSPKGLEMRVVSK